MAFGLVTITSCLGYLYYWNRTARNDPNTRLYVATNEDESLTIRKRTSRWD